MLIPPSEHPVHQDQDMGLAGAVVGVMDVVGGVMDAMRVAVFVAVVLACPPCSQSVRPIRSGGPADTNSCAGVATSRSC